MWYCEHEKTWLENVCLASDNLKICSCVILDCKLIGKTFYEIKGRVLCEKDYEVKCIHTYIINLINGWFLMIMFILQHLAINYFYCISGWEIINLCKQWNFHYVLFFYTQAMLHMCHICNRPIKERVSDDLW